MTEPRLPAVGTEGKVSTAPDASTFLLPTGTVTFLLTDVEHSTASWESAPELMAKAISRHYEILADAVGSHRGVRPVEQGEGDSIVAAFSRGVDAVAAALDAQQRLARETWPEGVDLRVRMALHTGDAQLRDAFNYYGPTVIRTARLRALAHGGQTIASRATRDLVTDGMPPGASWRDLGSHRLKDLGRPEHVFQLCHVELPDTFPALASLDATRNNLPAQLTTFVGRERELVEAGTLVDEHRLVTLTGSGGCGKSARRSRHDGAPFASTQAIASCAGDSPSSAQASAGRRSICWLCSRLSPRSAAGARGSRRALVGFDAAQQPARQHAVGRDAMPSSASARKDRGFGPAADQRVFDLQIGDRVHRRARGGSSPAPTSDRPMWRT